MTALTYSDTLTFVQARIAIESMGFSMLAFVADAGDHKRYTTESVLTWLGY